MSARVYVNSLGLVLRAERPHGIGWDPRQRRAFREEPPVGTAKAELAVGLSFDLKAFFVDCAVAPRGFIPLGLAIHPCGRHTAIARHRGALAQYFVTTLRGCASNAPRRLTAADPRRIIASAGR
jgi:hypothetical protein